jgi:flagellar motility protein MotE (MotC chaperone)
MMRLLSNPRYILLSIIVVSVMTLGLRMGDMWDVIANGKAPHSGFARAEDKPSDAKADAPAPANAPSPPQVDAGKAGDDKSVQGSEPKPSGSAAAKEEEDTSPAEMEVLKQLSNRRDQLDKRARDLDRREELMKVGEQRVDQKIKEMQSLRLQLQAMVDQIGGAQQTQLENLVKIYETMKPTDAAKIFETLDMPVLLGVIQRMKPKSTAPIMAAMQPEKAKEVTVALTKQDQLPQAAKEK